MFIAILGRYFDASWKEQSMTTHKIPWRIYVALIGSLVGTGIYSFALPVAILASTGEIGLAGVMAVAMQIPNIALAKVNQHLMVYWLDVLNVFLLIIISKSY